MATKAEAQAIINAIADGEENTAEEVRAMGDVLLNELFPIPVYDTDIFQYITSKIVSNISYAINFTKSGNKVSVQGQITTSAVTYFAPTDLIAFTDSNYAPNNGIIQKFKRDGVIFQVNESKITSLNTLSPSTTYYIDFTYVAD